MEAEENENAAGSGAGRAGAKKGRKVKRGPRVKKISARERRKYRIRKRVYGSTERPRLTVFKSSKHTYAQLVCDVTGATLASASTLDAEVTTAISALTSKNSGGEKAAGKASEKGAEKAEVVSSKSTKSVVAARAVGILLAKRCIDRDLKTVVFDRNGFIFHGRVKAVADGAREGGLLF